MHLGFGKYVYNSILLSVTQIFCRVKREKREIFFAYHANGSHFSTAAKNIQNCLMLMPATIHKTIDKRVKMLYKYIGEISGLYVRYIKNAYWSKTCDYFSLSLIFVSVYHISKNIGKVKQHGIFSSRGTCAPQKKYSEYACFPHGSAGDGDDPHVHAYRCSRTSYREGGRSCMRGNENR